MWDECVVIGSIAVVLGTLAIGRHCPLPKAPLKALLAYLVIAAGIAAGLAIHGYATQYIWNRLYPDRAMDLCDATTFSIMLSIVTSELFAVSR